MNLIKDSWLPVIRKNGSLERIRPAQLTSDIIANPVIRLGFNRPDLSAYGTYFLIGLFQSHQGILNNLEAFIEKPPSEDTLSTILDPSPFNLDGTSLRFMQEENTTRFNPDKNQTTADYLLFGSPAKIAVKHDRDWFARKGDVEQLCPSCAAIALYSRQINSYSAGIGYRTSSRSGERGVITTLVTGATLWETIILNILPSSELKTYGDSSKPLYPWMHPDLKIEVSTEDVHPCHYFWEMPTRLYLNFQDMDERCSICNEHINYGVSSVMVSNYGRKAHLKFSLSPYFLMETKEKGKKKGERPTVQKYATCSEQFSKFLKGQALFVTQYPNILKYLCSHGSNRPADAVRVLYETNRYHGKGLWVFGYNYDKSTFNGWVETQLSQLPQLFPEVSTIVGLSLSLADTLQFYVNRALAINEFRTSGKKEKKMPEVHFDFFNAVEPYIVKAVELKSMEGVVDTLVKKTLALFTEYIYHERVYLQMYKSLCTSINNSLKKLGLDSIELGGTHKKWVPSRKYKGIGKDLKNEIVRWWYKLGHHVTARNQLKRCTTLPEIRVSIAGEQLLNIFDDYMVENESGDVFQDRLLRAAQLTLFIKEHDWDTHFLSSVAASKDTRIKALANISDPAKEWVKVYQMLTILGRVNVANFIETIIFWDNKVSTLIRKGSI